MSIAGPPSRENSLWECALECAIRREKGRCQQEYSQSCNCKWNVAQYGSFSEPDLKLYMLQAEGEACYLEGKKSDSRKFWLAAIIIGTIVVTCTHYSNKASHEKYTALYSQEQQRSYFSLSPPTRQETRQEPRVTYNKGTTADVKTTLDRVSTRLRQGTDVNKDGLVNCIDAAVLFYQYYPYKDQVCIEVNKHPSNGFHHAFNCVLIDGNWVAIEPQAAWMKHDSYLVRDLWADKYDRQYNRDATKDYLKYVK